MTEQRNKTENPFIKSSHLLSNIKKINTKKADITSKKWDNKKEKEKGDNNNTILEVLKNGFNQMSSTIKATGDKIANEITKNSKKNVKVLSLFNEKLNKLLELNNTKISSDATIQNLLSEMGQDFKSDKEEAKSANNLIKKSSISNNKKPKEIKTYKIRKDLFQSKSQGNSFNKRSDIDISVIFNKKPKKNIRRKKK